MCIRDRGLKTLLPCACPYSTIPPAATTAEPAPQDVRATRQGGPQMLLPVSKSVSIRTWIGIGMVVALLPLLFSGITGYLVLNRDVIPLFRNTLSPQHDLIDPTQSLRLLIWSSVTPVEGFAGDVNLS